MIMPSQQLTIPLVDLSDMAEGERQIKALEIGINDATRPFMLNSGPMLRARLLRLAPEDHILLLTTHHVVCDDWSTGILVHELLGIYDAFNARKPSPFPEVSYQYSDFARRVHQQLQNKNLESRLAFWNRRLRGASNFHHVVPDHARSITRTYRGAHERAIFPQELRNAIELIARSERATPFMVLLAGLCSLLQCYSGDEDIGVGSCVANRPLVQLEGLIGPFANVAVLRTDLSGKPTFREVLRRVREVCLTAYSYQDLPFGTLLESLQLTPDSSQNPLFQILFVLLGALPESWQVPALTIEPFPLDTGTTRYELNLWVTMQETFKVDLQYNSDLFQADSARQIVQDYRMLLETISGNQEVRVRDIGITKRETQLSNNGRRVQDPLAVQLGSV